MFDFRKLPFRARSRRALAVLALTAVIGMAGCETEPLPVAPANDVVPAMDGGYGWFEAGRQWIGDFGDPHIVRQGNTYYAYSSPTGGRYLPVLTSTDLKTWTIHSNWGTGNPPWWGGDVNNDPGIPVEIRRSSISAIDKWNLNDGLVAPAAWGWYDVATGPWVTIDNWAPGVIQIGATWYAYSAVRTSWTSDDPHGYGRFCLTVASAPSPLGPFRDASGWGPIQCQPVAADPAGSIDPFPYHSPVNNKNYLLWKAAGKVGSHESALMAVALGFDGKPMPGAPWVKLLETNRADGWEGGTIENPGMVTYNGVTYLFYSANDSNADAGGNSDYATGYAICVYGPVAPCYRVQHGPLIAGGGAVSGPGGSAPFLAADGSLKVAYAAFWRGENRFPQPRRLHVGNVVQNGDATLAFAGDV